jgi:hypothetical protein
MPGFSLMQYLSPSRFRRRQMQAQVTAIRGRDGDHCTRCRRPMRFDRAPGHDDAPRVELLRDVQGGEGADPLANLCLTHGRCNVAGRDHTGEALERLRPLREAELFAKARDKQAA